MFLEFVNKKTAKKFNEDLLEAAKDHQITQIGLDDDKQIFKIVINPDAKRTVCFIAGLHGNEKAGPLGALEFLKSGFHIPKNKKVIVIPLANPTGFEANTRENADKVDLNRHFLDKKLKDECKCLWDAIKDEKIDLLHTLHEDPDLSSFYCYFTHDQELAENLRELATKYFKIYDKSERKPLKSDASLYGDRIYEGLIPLPHTVRGGIEDKVLLEYFVPYIVTESPGQAELKKRIEFNKNAMKMVIHSF
jgi:hypothetical protein